MLGSLPNPIFQEIHANQTRIKMLFNLNIIYAVVPFLTTAAVAIVMGTRTNGTVNFRGCFGGGEKWTDLGTTEQIYAALDDNACNVDTGGWRLGAKVRTA